MGKLTKKIQCQLTVCTRKPPIKGPKTVEMPNTDDSEAWARALSLGGRTSAITVMATTISAPPPNPCTRRPAIRTTRLPATPQIKPPVRKMPIATCKTILRPYISPSFPAIGAPTVEAKR